MTNINHSASAIVKPFHSSYKHAKTRRMGEVVVRPVVLGLLFVPCFTAVLATGLEAPRELTLDERVEYTRPGTTTVIADNAVFRYQSRLSEIADASLAMASANASYHSEIPYYDWMGMAGVDGHTLWGAAGKKYARLDSLPERFVAAVTRRYPTHFSDPLA